MRNPDSEIFNEYVKIAEEQGLVKDADYAEARIGSDTADVIEMLYGVRPNGEKKDENYSPLLDQAHPDPAVVAPAEDRMNGVVENLQERQSIMAFIALRTPDGAYIHRRYVKAQEELINSLVRVGFMMDNEEQEELMKMADSCAGRLEKQGIAFLAALPWLAGGVVSLLGGLALINRTDHARQSVTQNAEAVLRELADLKQFPIVQEIRTSMTSLKDMAQRMLPIEAQFLSLENAVDFAQQNPDKIKSMQEYVAKLQSVGGDIPRYVSNLEKLAQLGSGNSEYTPDWLQKLEDVGRYVFSITNDTEDVINALGGLHKAIAVALKQANEIMSGINGYKSHIEQKLQEEPGFLDKVMPSWMKERMPGGAKPAEKSDGVSSFVEQQLKS